MSAALTFSPILTSLESFPGVFIMARNLGLCVLVVLIGVVLLCSHAPTAAQGKKDDPAKTIQMLRLQLKERDQQILKLETQIQKLKLGDIKDDGKIAQLQQRIKQLEGELKGKTPAKGEKTAGQLKKELDAANLSIKEKDQLIASLQQKAPKATAELSKEVESLRKSVKDLEALKKAPFVHAMILKLKKVDEAQVKIVHDEAMKTLAKIPSVRGVWVGKRAEYGTPELAQTGFQLGVVVLLDDAEALQKFLDDPMHKQFSDRLADLWERPIVYDILRDPDAKK
jgi:predicted RNase H-like nuclease (RuvC/YqgF family)